MLLPSLPPDIGASPVVGSINSLRKRDARLVAAAELDQLAKSSLMRVAQPASEALVARMVDLGLGPQAAVEAPRWLFGRTWGEPSKSLRLESRFDEQVVASLRARGHDVQVLDAWSDLVGHAQAIALDTGGLRAGSDPRADGAAIGC